MELLHFRHIILYAKGHYRRNVLMDDLRKIISHECCLLLEHIHDKDIYKIVTRIFLENCPNYEVEDALLRLFTYKNTMFDPVLHVEHAIQNMLSKIAQIRVFADDGSVVLNIGEPDERVLPVRPFNFPTLPLFYLTPPTRTDIV